jgi:hypothetical protein
MFLWWFPPSDCCLRFSEKTRKKKNDWFFIRYQDWSPANKRLTPVTSRKEEEQVAKKKFVPGKKSVANRAVSENKKGFDSADYGMQIAALKKKKQIVK